MINPPGYAFEAYDELGRFRSTDNGQPVDAADSYFFEDYGEQFWSTGLEFIELVAESTEAHRCYGTHLFQYTHGRMLQSEDHYLLTELTQLSKDGASIQTLLLTVFAAETFRYRAQEAQ